MKVRKLHPSPFRDDKKGGIAGNRVEAFPGPSPGFRRRGDESHKEGPHFSNTILDVCSSRGAKHKTGGTDFK